MAERISRKAFDLLIELGFAVDWSQSDKPIPEPTSYLFYVKGPTQRAGAIYGGKETGKLYALQSTGLLMWEP